MKRRIALALVAIASIAAWRHTQQAPAANATRAPAIVAPAVVPTQTPAPADAPLPRVAAPPTALPLRPESSEPLVTAFPALLALAQSGDTDAMLDLGRRLAPCAPFALDGARSRVVRGERELAEAEQNLRDTPPDSLTPDERVLLPDVARMRASQDEQRKSIADCEAIDETQRGRSLAWIEAAADAGNESARRTYVTDALDDLRGHGDAALMLNIDTVIERRDRARRYMRESIEHCAHWAFITQATGLDRALGVSDPYLRAVAGRAAIRETQVNDDARASFAQRTFEQAVESLDAAARARAEQAGDAMYERCASQH
ncbi:MAG TPA: hypothetical protein VM555_06720 [Tahibacter sp.]|nr:hypothetical protein [Tahibacter sp.]